MHDQALEHQFAETLRKRRERMYHRWAIQEQEGENPYTQAALAERIGVLRESLSQWETEQAVPSTWRLAQAWARALGVGMSFEIEE